MYVVLTANASFIGEIWPYTETHTWEGPAADDLFWPGKTFKNLQTDLQSVCSVTEGLASPINKELASGLKFSPG